MFDIRKLVNGECRLVFYISTTKYLHRESTECLASSELLIPHPLSTQGVCPPPAPNAGGYTHSPGGGGGGEVQYFSEDARHWIGLFQHSPSTISTM